MTAASTLPSRSCLICSRTSLTQASSFRQERQVTLGEIVELHLRPALLTLEIGHAAHAAVRKLRLDVEQLLLLVPAALAYIRREERPHLRGAAKVIDHVELRDDGG